MKRKRLHIVSNFRFTLFLVICFLFVFTVANLALRLNVASSATIDKYEEIYIKKGDTLWSLVGEHFGNDVNKTKVIYEIEKLNDLDKYIRPGEVIKIPVYDTAKI